MAHSKSDDDALARRYLLQRLGENERAQVEERVFVDPGFLERVEIAEDDLIEDYASGEVSEADRALLIEFMTDLGRQQRAQLARQLRKHFATPAMTWPL